jgi:predicted acyltransferase
LAAFPKKTGSGRAVFGGTPYIYRKSFFLNQRYYSLDVFRGATVCLMILVNNPGSWGHIYSPLAHAPWHGLTPTDLVFPFFLFAVGNAMAFVMPRLQAAGDATFWKKVVKRSLLIFAIGLFLNWWPFARWQGGELVANGWTWVNAEGQVVGVRILGVLQRIALAYFFASVIVYYLKTRGAFLAGLIILLLYWLLTYTLGDAADPYSLQGYFGTAVDLALLGEPHLYRGEGVPFDPEGLNSTLPAIVQVIFGYLVGDYILKQTKRAAATRYADAVQTVHPLYRILTGLFIAAMAFLLAGYIWSLSLPVNKKIWTSSYVMVTTGMATAILATLVYFIELNGVRSWWTRFFDVFGKNALFVFALSAFLPKGLRLLRIPNGVNAKGEAVYTNPWNFMYDNVYKFVPGDPKIGSLLFALTVIFFMWAVCWWLDKKRIYIKV